MGNQVCQMLFGWGAKNYRRLSPKEKADQIIARAGNRTKFYVLLIKLYAVAVIRGIRLVIENPWSEQTYLKANFLTPPNWWMRTECGEVTTSLSLLPIGL